LFFHRPRSCRHSIPRSRTAAAADLEKLIAAVKPLYDTLDEGQKRVFAELMRRGGGERQHWRHEG
jgi:hypothetical protein